MQKIPHGIFEHGGVFVVECSYCGEEIEKTQGKTLVQTSGEKVHFCSGKCEKNFENDRSHTYPDK